MKITHVVLIFALCGHASARLNSDDGVEQDPRSLEIENDGFIGADTAGLSVVSNAQQAPSKPADPHLSDEFGVDGDAGSFAAFLAGEYDVDATRNVLISSNSTTCQAKIEKGAIKVNYQLQLVQGQNFVTASASQCKEWASDPECG
jgi:hypothetical protein